ncbi:abortive phage infection protein [Saccharopolyspora indica]|uniref:abortive phage infection protein n=1 Tax=Saccharopolyspora indica TaxID=1229659 RepID=UPI0022EB84A6|nr:abortive phage infection protein [Saccharopolyspora indica]MDA3647016.1 abortive phage infection protein [Saccharopolyspora indica]
MHDQDLADESHRGVHDLTLRGVSYDTGSNFNTGQGELSRVVWSNARMREEIAAIDRQLHCNSVTVYGSEIDRLTETAEAAAERGLHIWLQPRLMDVGQDEVLDHLAEAAELAERLRTDGAAVTFSVGCVHLVSTPGLLDGDTYHERMANIHAGADHNFLRPTATADLARGAERLNEFLGRAVEVTRGRFGGPVSYAAAPFEDVDWRPFDLVGLTYYFSYHPTRAGYAAELGKYREWGKPVVISEYGTTTYRGAAERALLAFDIVDRTQEVPTVYDGVVRNEQAQANFHVRMLTMFAELGMHGATVCEFIHPTHPHSTDPRYDLDAASMAITKTIRDDYGDHGSPYRWEPKKSFQAIAEHFATAAKEE